MRLIILLVVLTVIVHADIFVDADTVPFFPDTGWDVYDTNFSGITAFNGVDDRIILDQFYAGDEAFSIEAIVAPQDKQGYIFSQRDWEKHGVLLQYYPGSYQLFINNKVLKVKAEPDVWHYVVATFDGEVAGLYLDGELVDSDDAEVTWPDMNAVIGDRMTFNRQFLGSMFSVRLHKGVISQDYIHLVNGSLGKNSQQELLPVKWRLDFNNTRYKEIFPVMGDIDSDGVNELVFVASDNVYSVDAMTGEIEWVVEGSEDKAAELVDLDNDGTPEVLYSVFDDDTGTARLRALNGDGSERWTTQKVGGDGSPMFPIIAQDLDSDGYPTIFYATADVWPSPYNPEVKYNGTLNKIDHEGNILISTKTYRPCWGGLAIADVDSDGDYELYLGDRREGYLGFPSQGLQAFDADTLETLWTRPDIHLSSPMPKIADVIPGGNREIVAEHNINKGPIVVDALTGETILDYRDQMLSTHGSGTLVDLDMDGNYEIMMSTSDPMSAPMDFVVFDLIEGVTEFRPTFDYHVAWPPSAGDVTGNGEMEILVGSGNERYLGNYSLMIYDNEYNLIESINQSIGQMMPPRVFDIDDDGLNELVVTGIKGTIIAYDTKAPSMKGVDTWRQYYGNERLGAPYPKTESEMVIISDETYFNGIDNRIILDQIFEGSEDFHIEVMAKPADKHGYIISQRDWEKHGMLLQYYKGTIQLYSDKEKVKLPAVADEWHEIVADFSEGFITLEVDGKINVTDATITWPDIPTIIGDRATFNRQFEGYIEDLVIS